MPPTPNAGAFARTVASSPWPACLSFANLRNSQSLSSCSSWPCLLLIAFGTRFAPPPFCRWPFYAVSIPIASRGPSPGTAIAHFFSRTPLARYAPALISYHNRRYVRSLFFDSLSGIDDCRLTYCFSHAEFSGGWRALPRPTRFSPAAPSRLTLSPCCLSPTPYSICFFVYAHVSCGSKCHVDGSTSTTLHFFCSTFSLPKDLLQAPTSATPRQPGSLRFGCLLRRLSHLYRVNSLILLLVIPIFAPFSLPFPPMFPRTLGRPLACPPFIPHTLFFTLHLPPLPRFFFEASITDPPCLPARPSVACLPN